MSFSPGAQGFPTFVYATDEGEQVGEGALPQGGGPQVEAAQHARGQVPQHAAVGEPDARPGGQRWAIEHASQGLQS